MLYLNDSLEYHDTLAFHQSVSLSRLDEVKIYDIFWIETIASDLVQ
jgi:hypothetical protein